MYVKVKELPTSLQNALSSVGYGRHDIEVKASETYTMSPGLGGNGSRGFTACLNLNTGEWRTVHGAWGGANAFETTIDHDTAWRDLPAGIAIISGSEGHASTYATISVAPATLAALLPQPDHNLTRAQKVVLMGLKTLKSSYRRDEAYRYKVREHEYNATLGELVSLGLAKMAKNGATQITTEGKNALSNVRERDLRDA